MTRNRNRQAISGAVLAVLSLALSAPELVAQPTADRLQTMTSQVDLGEVSALATTPAETSIGISVTSAKPWQLAINSNETDAELSVHVAGEWVRLMPGVAHLAASGPETTDHGTFFTMQLRVAATFNTPPGKRNSSLSLALNGQPAETPIRIEYDIPAVVAINPELRPLTVTADHPAHHGSYDFEPQDFHVRSNTEWHVELTGVDTAAAAQSQEWTLEALGEDGRYLPLRDTIRIAEGAATGQRGVTVTLKVRVRLAPAAAAGRYTGDLRLRARVGRAAS